MEFQVLLGVFVSSLIRTNVDTNLLHETSCPEFGLLAAHSGGIFSTIQGLIPVEEE